MSIAPIHAYNDEKGIFVDPFYFDDTLSIHKPPNWISDESITKFMNYYQKKTLIPQAQLAFIARYQANAFGSPDPKWGGEKSRSIQETAMEKINVANLALWLSKPSLINFEILIHAEEYNSKWFIRQSFTPQLRLIHEDDKENQLQIKDLNLAKDLYKKILLTNHNGSIWIAIRSISQALQSLSWELRFLIFWIALEALFGTDSELTYRLSLRIALFIEKNKNEQKELLRSAKKLYRERGKVVHGRGIPGKEQKDRKELMKKTENIVRKAMLKIFKEDNIRQIFSSNKREDFLDNLIFN